MIISRVAVLFLVTFAILSGHCAEMRHGHLKLVGTNVVALGTYPSADERTARVPIKNTGDGVLQIGRVLTTCKCMRVDGYPRKLGPGETGEVSVSILKNEVSGAFHRVFYIESDDPRNARVKVKIEGYAQPLFHVACDNKTALGPVEPGQVWTGKYTVAATETGLSLGTAAVQNRGARCEYSILTNQHDKVTYEVTQTVTFDGDGLLESVLLFPVRRSGKTETPPLRLEVTAFRNRPLRVVPDRLTLSISGRSVQHRFLVSVNCGGPADSKLVTCTSDWDGMGVSITRAPNSKNLFATLTFSEAYVKKLTTAGKGSISFKYGDKAPVVITVALE